MLYTQWRTLLKEVDTKITKILQTKSKEEMHLRDIHSTIKQRFWWRTFSQRPTWLSTDTAPCHSIRCCHCYHSAKIGAAPLLPLWEAVGCYKASSPQPSLLWAQQANCDSSCTFPSRPLTIFIDLSWMLSNNLIFILYCGAQNSSQCSR